MSFLKYYLSLIYRTIKNRVYYIKNRSFIHELFQENGYQEIKPFNLSKWHHDLYLFTAIAKDLDPVFIKITNLPRLLKNENKAYKKLQKNKYLVNHLIEHKGYIKKNGYRALVLKRAKGIVLNEEWAANNIGELNTLIRIVDEFKSLSLVHRDIKLDNFIYEDGSIKIFDFSFMIDKTQKGKLKEIDLSDKKNILKLMDLGIHYKPAHFTWDDYYSLYVILNSLQKKGAKNLSKEGMNELSLLVRECKEKINTNTYSVMK